MAGIVAAAIAAKRPEWDHLRSTPARQFTCGYCDLVVGPHLGYTATGPERIYICPSCGSPSFFSASGLQVPPPSFGNHVDGLPDDVRDAYAEARACISVGAYTAAALLCRKLLMSVAVARGAKPGAKFVDYVDFIEAQHLVPPGNRPWLDDIRRKGNEATHEIPSITRGDAEEILTFVELLLKFVFEMPARMAAKAAAAGPQR